MNTPAGPLRRTMILPVMCLCVVLIIATVAAINVSVLQIETSSLHPSNTQLRPRKVLRHAPASDKRVRGSERQ